MKRLAFALLALLAATPARANPPVTLTDQSNAPVGTAANPLAVTAPAGAPIATTASQGAPNSGGTAAWWVQWAGQSVVVSSLPSLPAGSAIVGRVGLDQTTPGATNGVVVNASALPAGAALEAGGNLSTIATRTPPLGQATKAASQPVVVASDQGALTAAPVGCTVVQNVVALPANASTQLAGANPNRRGLELQNIGANPATVAMGTSATYGAGLILAAGTSNAGGSERFFTGAVPTNAVSAIATAATTMLVWECQ